MEQIDGNLKFANVSELISHVQSAIEKVIENNLEGKEAVLSKIKYSLKNSEQLDNIIASALSHKAMPHIIPMSMFGLSAEKEILLGGLQDIKYNGNLFHIRATFHKEFQVLTFSIRKGIVWGSLHNILASPFEVDNDNILASFCTYEDKFNKELIIEQLAPEIANFLYKY
jgi:hypothetical protein